jgi:hypothetical protein
MVVVVPPSIPNLLFAMGVLDLRSLSPRERASGPSLHPHQDVRACQLDGHQAEIVGDAIERYHALAHFERRDMVDLDFVDKKPRVLMTQRGIGERQNLRHRGAQLGAPEYGGRTCTSAF